MAEATQVEAPAKPSPEEKRAAAEAEVDALVKKGLKALDEFEKLDQKQVDRIVAKASVAAITWRIIHPHARYCASVAYVTIYVIHCANAHEQKRRRFVFVFGIYLLLFVTFNLVLLPIFHEMISFVRFLRHRTPSNEFSRHNLYKACL